MENKVYDMMGNVYYNLIRDEVAVENEFYLDFNASMIKGPRPINKVIHSHPRLELSVVKSGSGKYCIEDKVYDIEPGDVFIINNIEPHGIELTETEALTNMVLHFEPRFVWSQHNNFDSRFLKIFFDRSEHFSHKLDNKNIVTTHIRQLMFEMEGEFINKEPEYQLMVKVKLLNILALLLRHYNCYIQEESSVENAHELKVIKRVTDYVDERFTGDIKLKELADIAHMNPTYFSTFFKKYNGLSPIDYIIRKRVTRAIDYLLATDKTVIEISGLCGFNNSANFNKMFKKITGETPSGYRKRR